jgi:hypothetical protein
LVDWADLRLVVDDDGQCDGGEFKLDTAPVVAGAPVEGKEARRVRPLLAK